jgi:hypothetical protein
MKKFLVAIQYWEGDREDAFELMKLLADTVQEDNPWADLVVWYRFDTTPPSGRLVEALERVFTKVYVLQGPQQVIGYPNGCNSLWSELVMKAYRLSTESVRGAPAWAEYKSVLAIESDTCPLSDDWLEKISQEWDANKCVFMGTWIPVNNDHPSHPDIGHINGNAMFDIHLAKIVPSCMGTPCFRAWDTWHSPAFKAAGWYDTKLIQSMWNQKTITEKEIKTLKKNGCVLLHGIKDASVRELYHPAK